MTLSRNRRFPDGWCPDKRLPDMRAPDVPDGVRARRWDGARWSRRGEDRGAMSVFVVIFSIVVFSLAGLLVDGGAAINARLKAADVAEQGARAAADRIDVEALRATGRVRLSADDRAVCARAGEIVSRGADGVRMTECVIDAGQAEVTVGVGVRWEALFLSAFGVRGSDMEATATAGPEEGVA
jgi:hypothetical protein